MKFKLLMTAFAAAVSTTSMANEFVNKPSSLDIPIATLNQAGFTAEGLKRIDTFFASEIEKKRVPGGVVGIVRDGKLVYLKAHGMQNPETQEPMKVDTIFGLASMTKPMVSVGTLTLTQQAKLPLFSKVSDYYPDVANMKVANATTGIQKNWTCEELDKPVQVTNMPGAGGGLAFNTVVNERNDDADLIIAASSATTTRLAQNAYAGRTADEVRFVGAIGADPGIIAVAADSPYNSLKDLVDAILADPGSVAFAGGSAVGGFDHLKPLMVLKEAGFTDITKIKYIGVDGGADAITQTVGGFTQAMTGDMSEVVSFLANGDIRVIAVLTDERVPGFEDIPTATEQGYSVVAVNWRGLYVPKGVSDDTFNSWADKLQMVADSAEWKEAMAANGLAPFTKVGGNFQGYVDGLVADINAMSKELGVIQ